MIEIYSIIGVIVGVIIISISLGKLRKQTITQGTFALWVIAGVILTIFSGAPFLIYTIQNIIGTQFTLSAIFGVSFIFLIAIVFYLHQKVDIMNQRITKLVAELAANKFYKSDSKDDTSQ